MKEIVISVLAAILGALLSDISKKIYAEYITTRFLRSRITKLNAPRTQIALSVIQSGKLIVMTKRKGNDENITWSFPSAKIKADLPVYSTLVSKYYKKLNIRIKPIKILGVGHFPNGDWELIYFHCVYNGGRLFNNDVNENECVEWVDINEVEGRVTTKISPEIQKAINKIKNEN